MAGIYGLVFQLENYYMVPRIMGRRLQLHPLVVIMGALAGASVAGVLGILLAAPTLATARLFISYVYAKLLDKPLPEMIEKVVIMGEDDTAVTPHAVNDNQATQT